MDAALKEFVRRRANHRCEYCGLAQANFSVSRFQVEHIVARKHDGGDELDNLALACLHCNSHKGTDLSGLDPLTGALTRLYHPRRDAWDDHFRQHGILIAGLTDIGRTTVRVLNMNSKQQLRLREAILRIARPVE
jgi:hypothetical protein